MSEISFIFRSHPLLITILALGISPVFISVLVIFSPILFILLLFLLGVAGLARSTRRKLHRSRRRRKHPRSHLQESLLGADDDELLRGEKQIRVNEYLEDQLRHLGDSPPLEESLLCGRLDESPGAFPEELGIYSDFRSDVSDFGDRSLMIPGDWEDED